MISIANITSSPGTDGQGYSRQIKNMEIGIAYLF